MLLSQNISQLYRRNWMENSTIFDDVLRTIQERLPRLLIPLINEVFQTSFTEDTVVTRLADGQVVTYKVPVLRLKDYTIEEIFEKNLLILLPYYINNYEKEISKIAKDEERTQQLIEEYKSIVIRLEKVAKNDDIGFFRDLAGMMRRIVEYLLRKEPDLKERVSETMGGKVLRLPSDELREAKEVAMAEGRVEGRVAGLIEATMIIVE